MKNVLHFDAFAPLIATIAVLAWNVVALGQQPVCPVECANVSVHDGDTIVCSLRLSFGVVLEDRHVRAFGYDAWEVTKARRTVNVTDVEIERGKVAKKALEDLIATGRLYAEDSGQRDPYGRTSARLWLRRKGEWIDVAEYMKRNHHCRDL